MQAYLYFGHDIANVEDIKLDSEFAAQVSIVSVDPIKTTLSTSDLPVPYIESYHSVAYSEQQCYQYLEKTYQSKESSLMTRQILLSSLCGGASQCYLLAWQSM